MKKHLNFRRPVLFKASFASHSSQASSTSRCCCCCC